jgi:hypothetical protein
VEPAISDISSLAYWSCPSAGIGDNLSRQPAFGGEQKKTLD